MSKRRGIYVASKASHGQMWRTMRGDGVPIISTWIDECGPGESPCLTDLWARNVSEASSAIALVAYAQPGDVPKGALVEIGAALACGVPVFWVGPHDGQTIVHHPLVTICPSLLGAIHMARERTRKSP